jgi:hypothetical protein
MKKNLLIKILVLIIAILLWIQQILLRPHDVEFQVPIKLLNIPNNLALQEVELPTLTVLIKAKGYDLLSAKVSQVAFEVDASNYKYGDNQIKLHTRDLSYSKRVQLDVVELVEHDPIFVHLDKLVEKQKPIKVEYATSKDEEFFIENKITNAQQRVGIKGPLSLLHEIKTIKTEPVSQKMVEDSKITATLIIPNANVQLLKDKVILNVTHTKIIIRTISLIPIKFPETANITIIPQKVSIMVTGPEELVEKMDLNSVTANLEIDKVRKGFAGVTFELPSGVKIVEFTPKGIQVIQNEENTSF